MGYEADIAALERDVMRHSDRMERIQRKAYYESGDWWSPRIKPLSHPLVEKWYRDRKLIPVLDKEMDELKQHTECFITMVVGLKASGDGDVESEQKLVQAMQASQQIRTLLESRKDRASHWGASSPASIRTSTAAVELMTKKPPAIVVEENPLFTLQGPSLASSPQIAAWKPGFSGVAQGAMTKVKCSVQPGDTCTQEAEADEESLGCWTVVSKAVMEKCTAMSIQLRRGFRGNGYRSLS
ncbi:g3973 [Coccomyxa viridis]|uniref:G3973 protein n=1 Tax=Coccomyxa viridis TaxID=1274662 RepID=A0ABP1FQN5_9CHLO